MQFDSCRAAEYHDLMKAETASSKVLVSQSEYARLKEIDKQFGKFLAYASHSEHVRAARAEVKGKKTVAQEKLFKSLGL
jgi:PHD/YefM family antitoxin component YafN of YafNO toxin-antitoxin module